MLSSPFSVLGSELSGYMREDVSMGFIPKHRPGGLIMPIVVDEVESGNPFDSILPLEASVKIRACISHFRDNVPWEETGIIERSVNYAQNNGGSLDGRSTYKEFKRRYRKLDELWGFLKSGGRLKSNPFDDAIVHIGMKGEVYFGGGATHRAAMAWLLNIPIPVRPFLIHGAGKHKLLEMLHIGTSRGVPSTPIEPSYLKLSS